MYTSGNVLLSSTRFAWGIAVSRCTFVSSSTSCLHVLGDTIVTKLWRGVHPKPYPPQNAAYLQTRPHALTKAVHSASELERVTELCNLDLQAIGDLLSGSTYRVTREIQRRFVRLSPSHPPKVCASFSTPALPCRMQASSFPARDRRTRFNPMA